MDELQLQTQALMMVIAGTTLAALVGGLPLLAWVWARRLLVSQSARRQLAHAGFEKEGATFVVRRWGTTVHARLRHHGVVSLEIWGEPLPEGVPTFRPASWGDGREDGDRWQPVCTGDPAFDRQVHAIHGVAHEGLAWLTGDVRRHVRRAVEHGAGIIHGRWCLTLSTTSDPDVATAARLVARATSALSTPRGPLTEALEALTHDDQPGVIVRAMEVLAEREALRPETLTRLARGPYAKVHLAVIRHGREHVLDAWRGLGRAGSRRQRAVGVMGAIEAAQRETAVFEEADGDRLIAEPVEALLDPHHGDSAAQVLRDLDRPTLARELAERFGADAPPRVHTLRRQLVERHGREARGAVGLASGLGGGLALAEDGRPAERNLGPGSGPFMGGA